MSSQEAEEGRSCRERSLSPQQQIHRLLVLPGQDVLPVYLYSLMALVLATDDEARHEEAEEWASYCRHLLLPAAYSGAVISETKGLLGPSELTLLKAVQEHGHIQRSTGRCSTTGLSVRTFDATVARLRSMHLIVVVPGLRDGLPGRPKGTYEPGWALELIVPALANVSGRVR